MPLKNIENSRYYSYVNDWKLLYEAGDSTVAIAKKYNVGNFVVYSHLKLLGIVRGSKESSRLSEKHPQWKGDSVGYNSLHRWVKTRLEKPDICPKCNLRVARDLANVSNTYSPETYNRNLNNWRWLCRKCHMIEDGRMEKFLVYARNHNLRYK